MKDIEPLASYGVIEDVDVKRTINTLERGSRYASKDVFDRYCELTKQAGRNPGHRVAFGAALSRLGLKKIKMTVGGPGQGYGRKGRGKQTSAWAVPWDFGKWQLP